MPPLSKVASRICEVFATGYQRSRQRETIHSGVTQTSRNPHKPVTACPDVVAPVTTRGKRMLSVSGLNKTFGQNKAVDDLTFDVDRPQFVGIIGRSGAGKSTFLRMVNRLTDATSGRLTFEGRDILGLSGAAKRAWQSDCAMIFQQFNLVPRMDVISNVLHGTLNKRSTLATMFNIFPQDDIHRAIDILERLGIAEHGPKRAEALSGGQQQRVAIARALMQDPKMILADEPIASLDPMNAQVVMEALRRIHDEDGRMVIANLHTLDTARRYCVRRACR